MYLLRRAWAELQNEVFVLPSRTLVLLWVLALLALPSSTTIATCCAS
jgi:hypothetical protein